MKYCLLLLTIAFSAVIAEAQRPITFEDLAAIHRIGAPRVSPDGKWIAYDSSMPDLAANTSRSAIFLIPSTGGASKQITEGKKQDSSPMWSPDGKTIAYVSNRDGAAHQVYFYDVASGASRKVAAGASVSALWRGLITTSGRPPSSAA